MNRIILLVLFVFSYCVGSSQAITQRGTSAVTVQDARLFAQYNFRPPVFSDTTQANSQIGLDSCGALIFARNINAYYYRACSPKRWVAITSGGGSGNSWNIGGNASPSSPDIGTTTVSELDIITNGIARAKILASGINRSAAARNKYLMIDTTSRYLYYGDAGTTIDTTSLSNRINLKIDSLKKSNDSIYAYRNGTRVFQYINSDTVYTQSPIMSITRNDSNIIFFNADTANVWRGNGTGGVGGGGTQYYVPKWSASTTLTNSQIFDSVNVGINTTSPTYRLDVNGTTRIKNDLYADEDFVVNNYFAINTTATDFPIPDGDLGIWRKNVNGYGTKFLEDEQGAAKDKWAFVKRQGYNGLRDWFQTNSSIVNINYGWGNPSSSNYEGNTLLIDPKISIGNPLLTGTKIRGIYYNPDVDSIVNTTHIAFESTSGNVVMKGLKTSNSTTDSIAIWINDTLSKAPYPSGTNSSDTAKVVIAQVHNATGTTLLKGEVVYLFGSTGNVASVKRANNKDDSTSSRTFGMVRRDIPAGGTGFITTQGQIEKLNLGSPYAEGDILWLDSIDGGITKVKPQAPLHGVFIGIVERANSGNGLAYIKIANGVELEEVHDVQINNVLNNQIIVYSDTQKVWKNRNINSLIDTTLFQRKSIQPYSFLANNTPATANAQALSFKDTSGIYTLSPVWGTSAPTGPTNHTYRWTRIGNMVTLNISLVYGTVSSNNTTLTIPLPTDCPTPVKPTGLTAVSNFLYPAYCNGGNTLNTAGNLSARGGIRSNSNNNGFEFAFSFVGNPFIFFQTTVTYYTN